MQNQKQNNQKQNKNKNKNKTYCATHTTDISYSTPNCAVPPPPDFVVYLSEYQRIFNQICLLAAGDQEEENRSSCRPGSKK